MDCLIVTAAITRLNTAGFDTTALTSVSVQVASLDDALGLAGANTVLIDDDAFGHGWFIDATPLDDEEFEILASDSQLQAADTSAAYGQFDLLTVVMHELGHLLGLAHQEDGLMQDTLATSTRLLSEADVIDQVLTDW